MGTGDLTPHTPENLSVLAPPLFFKAQVPEKQKSVREIPNPEGPGTWGKWELPRLQFSKQAWQLTLPTWPQGHPEHSMVPMKTKLDRRMDEQNSAL